MPAWIPSASMTSSPSSNHRRYEEFIRPTDLGIDFKDPISKFKFQRSPVLISSRNIEELEKNLIKSYLGNVGVEFEGVETIEEK